MAKPSAWWPLPTLGEWLYLALGLTLGAACALLYLAAENTALSATLAPGLGAAAAIITASIAWQAHARAQQQQTTERRSQIADEVLITCGEFAELLRSVARRDVESATRPGQVVPIGERFPMLYEMLSAPEPLARLATLRTEVQALFPTGTDACLDDLLKLHTEMKSALDDARTNPGGRELPSEEAYKRMEPVMGQPGLDRIDKALGAVRECFRKFLE